MAWKDLIPPARTCQYPLWTDDEVPGSAYCGSPVQHGPSYCPTHHARCWTRPARLVERRAAAPLKPAGAKA